MLRADEQTHHRAHEMSVFDFVIAALAVFRLSLLLSKEHGPMWVFSRLRRAVPKESSAKEGISCQWCVSLWFAIPVSAYVFTREAHPEWLRTGGDWFLLMLALSAGAIAVNQAFTKG